MTIAIYSAAETAAAESRKYHARGIEVCHPQTTYVQVHAFRNGVSVTLANCAGGWHLFVSVVLKICERGQSNSIGDGRSQSLVFE